MSSRNTRPGSESGSSHVSGHGPGDDGIVSEWRDATTFAEADLSGEVAGQKVIPLVGHRNHHAAFEPAIKELLGSYPGTPGFLFNGDDGDSLWFWPEAEPVAFRFQPEAANRLRMELVENVSRLVSQGALVFCYQDLESSSGNPVFHFPELGLRAA